MTLLNPIPNRYNKIIFEMLFKVINLKNTKIQTIVHIL